jgi:hypothetical protein
MKKILFFLCLIAFLATGCSLKLLYLTTPKEAVGTKDGYIYYNCDRYRYHDEEGYYKGKLVNRTPEGLFKWYYDDGYIRMRGHFKNGKKEGLFETFYENNGPLMHSAYFKNDLENGPNKLFNKNGTTKASGFYKDGKKIKYGPQ